MQIKTSELSGPSLDWAVAKCEGLNAGVLTIDDQVGEHEDIMRQHYSDAEWEEHLKAWNNHVLPTIKPRLVAFDDEGFPIGFPLHYDGKGHRIAYSTKWAQGGPIIEREKLSVVIQGADAWHSSCPRYVTHGYGTTPLIAAMRCYVASKMGNGIDVPDELV